MHNLEEMIMITGGMGMRILTAAVVCCALQAQSVPPLAGTRALEGTYELAEHLMDGAHLYVERKIRESSASRQRHWRRDFSSMGAYEESVRGNRARFLEKIGVVDARVPVRMERFGDDASPALVAETAAYRVYQVRWTVLEGVHGEGLLLEPRQAPACFAVSLADADQTPEQSAGLAGGLDAEAQIARRLVESGCLVVSMALADRSARFSGRPDIRMTDQPHREWIYRQAFQMGRHIIGYEVQKVKAAVEWLHERAAGRAVGVAGYGEGGLLAFYAAAADTRISAALVSGYFRSREQVWAEPIFRNVWGLLEEFGDAEIATLIAPRALVVHYEREPSFRSGKGDLSTPGFEEVEAEFRRIGTLLPEGFQPRILTREPKEALGSFLLRLESKPGVTLQAGAERRGFDEAARQRRQVKELEAHVQNLVRESEHTRAAFYPYKVEPRLADSAWFTALKQRTLPAEGFVKASRWYRDYFWKEVLGKFEEKPVAPNARTRRIYDTEKWTGYDVLLDVYEELPAWGVLLVPKDMRPGERRPVVVCQHGRRGLPRDLIEDEDNVYHRFAAKLAERGFVVFVPHNLYRAEDRYRWLDRKANSVKASLFSFILAQHDQILRWLGSLAFVDASRIGFYGLSYGGETAVRVPTILEGYSLSICSGDFNNWTRKVAATDEAFSFMYTIEWEMPYFNMGSTFDYGEMAYLMIPRPFMVERGHHDRVGRDRWVAYEYAKVKWLYTQLGLGEKTEIEYFNGGHAINGQGTYEFLHRHLRWPVR
jgi:dienelactone hydrolase